MSDDHIPHPGFRYLPYSDWASANANTNDRGDRAGPATLASPTEELERAVARFHQNVGRILAFPPLPTSSTASNMSSGSDRELRRRFNRDPEPLADSGAGPGRPPNYLPPLRALHRIGMSSGESVSRSSRYRERRQLSLLERLSANSLDDFTREIEDENSRLRTLFDTITNPPAPQPALSPPLQTSDNAEDSRRIKRRKLESDKMAPGFKAVRYGRYGQVEPGQLTMEIVSCDGGVYSSDGSRDCATYMAENILKNDSSVYCTKGCRCNIVLRHQGGTVFSLKELVIKAPASRSFTSPVREGMVFVSMDEDELLTRTAQYQIQYLHSRSNPLPNVHSIRYDLGSARSRREYQPSSYDDDDDDCRTAQIPAEFTASSPCVRVTTEYSHDHFGDEDLHSGYQPPGRRQLLNRIGTLPFESDGSDDGAEVWIPETDNTIRWDARARRRSTTADRPRSGHGDMLGMTLDEAREASQAATQEAVRAVGGELMSSLARFHIEKDKNVCTMHFDPPVSGRFLLLKMWSPLHDTGKNIDIQAVIAKGFAGPRYIPSVEMR